MIAIRPLAADDRDAWHRLWQGDLDFYETKLDPRITENTWRRLLDPQRPAGVLPRGPVRRPSHARAGAGHALIEGVVALAKAGKWRRVYWTTRDGNATARRLYDRIAPATDWVRYDIDIPL